MKMASINILIADKVDVYKRQSYAKRILFIKDGEIFSELVRGTDSRREFFERILQVVTLLGGDSDALY